MVRKIIDGHVHLSGKDFIPVIMKISESLGYDKVGLVSIAQRDSVNDNPTIYYAKSQYPEFFYAFAALDHSAYYLGEGASVPSYAQQVQNAIDLGADGIKLLETKPDRRKAMDVPIDSPVYEPMFALLEEKRFPIVWHVADPEEFWDPDTTPGWAKQNDWGYDQTFVPYQQFYKEVDNVMNRHPKLKVTFAHFYFLSADLQKAGNFLDRYENVNFDLAPGIEMLYNLSKDPEASREFFIERSKRIVFGSDMGDFLTYEEGLHRARMVFRWLESEDEFRVPEGADFLLGPPEDGIIRGMRLPDDVLDDIYCNNYQRFAGSAPRKLDMAKVESECSRIAELVRILKKNG